MNDINSSRAKTWEKMPTGITSTRTKNPVKLFALFLFNTFIFWFKLWEDFRIHVSVHPFISWKERRPERFAKFEKNWLDPKAKIKNLPNAISLSRLILTWPIVWLLLIDTTWSNIWALAIFVIMALSDAIDGPLAKGFKCETILGKCLDPLADKVLILAVMMTKNSIDPYLLPALIWAMIIGETLYMSARVYKYAVGINNIAANNLGKTKMGLEVVVIIFQFLIKQPSWSLVVNGILFAAFVLLAINLLRVMWEIRKHHLTQNFDSKSTS